MKYIKFFMLFLLSSSAFCQDEIAKDSIILKGKVYYFTFITYGKYSGSKPVKVFTCNKKDLKAVKETIQKIHKEFKVDYTDFYIIPLENGKDLKNGILKNCLSKIDKIRMSRNLYTIQIPSKENYNKEDRKSHYTYDTNSIIPLDKIECIHKNITAKDIKNILREVER